MKKIKFLPFLLLLLSLCGTAPAFFTDSLATGDANNLHLEFDFEWFRNHNGGGFTGTWEGGTYMVSGGMNTAGTLPIPNDPNGAYMIEIRPDFWVRTIWNDGYDPGWVGNMLPGTYGAYYGWTYLGYESLDPFYWGVWAHPDYPWRDYSGNNSQYYYSATARFDSISLDMVTRNGSGSMTWEFSRLPCVPDSGSTLAMFGMALAILGGGKILRNSQRGAAYRAMQKAGL